MNKAQPAPEPAVKISRVALCAAIVLSLIGCTLFLIIPTQSLTVDTVYEGF